MAKYSKKIVNEICELIKKDSYTTIEICRHIDISEETYYKWLREKPEFSESIKEAQLEWRKTLAFEAKRSLRKLVNGFDFDETQTIYVDSGVLDENNKPKPKVKEQRIIKKHIFPNLGAVTFALTNAGIDIDENWKNTQSNELTGKDGKDLIPEPITVRIIDDKEQLNGNTNDKNIPTG